MVEELPNQSFPNQEYHEIECNHLSFDTFLEQLRKQAILDTAMDAMGIHLEGNQTTFNISRLAAYAGKLHSHMKKNHLVERLKFALKV